MEKLNTSPSKFARNVDNYEITLDEAIEDQEKLENSIIRVEKYKPRKTKLKEEIRKLINNGIIFIKKKKSENINNDLFKKYFDFSAPIDLANKLYETKDAKEKSELIKEIKNRWSN